MFEKDDVSPLGMMADIVVNAKRSGMLVETIAFVYGKTSEEVLRDILAEK